MVFLFGAADDPDCEPLAMLKANRSMQGSSDYRALQVELKDNARLKAVIDGRHKSVADYVTSQDEVVVVGRNVSGTHPLITADFEAGVSPAATPAMCFTLTLNPLLSPRLCCSAVVHRRTSEKTKAGS